MCIVKDIYYEAAKNIEDYIFLISKEAEHNIMGKRIGIITIYDLSNFGNRLQNYATIAFLKRLGYKPETVIVDYIRFNTLAGRIYHYIKGTKAGLDWNHRQEDPDYISAFSEIEKTRYRNFYEFTYRYAKPVYLKYFEKIQIGGNHSYDYYLVGSDQVWNPTIGQAKDWEFLRFVPEHKRIAWSASFGIDSFPCTNITKKKIVSYIQHIPYISVRESAGAKIVKDLTGRDVDVLIDPALLLTSEEWSFIAEEPSGVDCNQKYILVYFLGSCGDEANSLIEQYRNKGFLIFDLMDEHNKNLYVCGPSHFIYLISKASLVITDSFHACIFSFLFNKPFFVYDRVLKHCSMNSRIFRLLTMFHLERKYAGSELENDIWEHDYSIGYEQLAIERQKSMEFLQKALNIVYD